MILLHFIILTIFLCLLLFPYREFHPSYIYI